MKIIHNPFEPIPSGRVFAIHGGPLDSQRVVFTDTPVVDSFEAQGATYRRTSCGFRVDVLTDVDPGDEATESAVEAGV